MEKVQKVRSTFEVHCARGAHMGCKKCQAAKEKGTVYQLIEPDSNEQQAARMIEEFRDPVTKEKWMQEYRVVKTFESEEEARKYAKDNNIEDVRL